MHRIGLVAAGQPVPIHVFDYYEPSKFFLLFFTLENKFSSRQTDLSKVMIRVYMVLIAPAYSKVRYRGSNFRPFVRSFVRSSVRPSVNNLCQGAYSVAVIAGSMKPCIVITLDTHFKKAPDPVPMTLISRSTDFVKILYRV